MQLEDIEEEAKKKTQEKRRDSNPNALDVQRSDQPRRGSSSLLAAAGIDYERRRKLSHQQQGDTKYYQEGNDILMEGKDGKVTKMEILEVTEKMGMLRKAVPALPLCLAIFLCFLNTFLPGIGTLIGAASLLCCGKSRHENTCTGIKYGVLAGIIQILTTVLIIGWIYSIIYGVHMIQDSMTRTATVAVSPQTPSAREEESAKPPDAKQNQAWA